MTSPAAHTRRLTHTIVKNTVYNTIGRFWGILISIFLTPYIVHYIGLERFGVWAIIGVVTSYFGLLDFGVGSSFIKYIAEFYAQGEHDKINEVVNTGFFFYSVFALVITLIALAFLGPIIALFKVPARVMPEATFVFMAGVATFAFSNAISPLLALQGGLQRMDISNIIGIGVSFLNIAGTVFFLRSGYGLPGLMINNILMLAISSAACIFFTVKIFPQWKLGARFVKVKVFIQLFTYGYKLQVSRLANLISFQADKLLIAYFLGVGMVTFYQLGSSLLQSIRQVPLLLVSAIVPAVSEVEAQKDRRSLEAIFIRGSKYLIITATPLVFFVVIDAHIIMAAWMGRGYDLTVGVIRLLSIGYFAATVTGAASSIAAGVGRTDIDMRFGLVMAISNIILSITLILTLGFLGAVLGTTISLFFASIYYMKLFHRYFGKEHVAAFIRLFPKPIVASAVSGAVIYGLNIIFFIPYALSGRIAGLTVLFWELIVFVLVYGAIMLRGSYITMSDRELITARIPQLKKIVSMGLR